MLYTALNVETLGVFFLGYGVFTVRRLPYVEKGIIGEPLNTRLIFSITNNILAADINNFGAMARLLKSSLICATK